MIEADNFKIRDSLKEHANEKLEKLKDFLPTSVRLLLKKENCDNNNKKAELVVKLPGFEFFAESSTNSFEKSITKVINKVKKQIIKAKEKKKNDSL